MLKTYTALPPFPYYERNVKNYNLKFDRRVVVAIKMNILRRSFSLFSTTISSLAVPTCNVLPKSLAVVSAPCQQVSSLGVRLWDSVFGRSYASLQRMHRTGPYYRVNTKRRPLDGKPFMKGVVLKTLIKKPKKPNSANRKCVMVRLSNGREMVAHVPGIGHNLQEHNIVLCRVGRLKDCPGVKIKCVRGKYDLPHVVKQDTS